jgi:corrinoid protein of di/trimethylamine methyltransferase
MSSELLQAMAQSIIDGEIGTGKRLAQQAIDLGIDPLEAIDKGFVPGMNEVGDQFSKGKMFLPHLVQAAQVMKAGVAILQPEITKRGTARQTLGKVVLGTVKGDIHDIGKNLVGIMLSANGFEVHDLGHDVPVSTFVEKARELNADMVGMSALLTTTMMRQRDVIKALEASGLRSGVKVIVGGASVSRKWVEEIGADGYSKDAVGAVTLAKALLAKK